MPDEQVPGPEQAGGAPGGPAVPGDDGGEAGQGETEEHRAVRVTGTHIDQGDDADPVRHGHRIPVPHHEQSGPGQQQEPGEAVQRHPPALRVRGPPRADLCEDGHEQRRAPGRAPPGPLHPPPPRGTRALAQLFHTATLDGVRRHPRHPGVAFQAYSPRSTRTRLFGRADDGPAGGEV